MYVTGICVRVCVCFRVNMKKKGQTRKNKRSKNMDGLQTVFLCVCVSFVKEKDDVCNRKTT